MSDDLREIANYELPYSRKAELREVTFDGGMKMLRLILREGRRITQVDLDGDSAAALADAMGDWARQNS
ncbi:DUF6967 family protein [Sinisalibacter aestuarii]|uniref:Uncharacterized protein n=1 Tax=Sinisalibacter aestuarii TaxID=2949426 RepID=A0ABQ5LN74_9RHOB|nr:hypothetical protein [Sinisalibacter aestuarii]GKY86409.1 hypothetical protein STA1M1_02780 [Sinisalibacter aestuarii]